MGETSLMMSDWGKVSGFMANGGSPNGCASFWHLVLACFQVKPKRSHRLGVPNVEN